MSAMMALAVTGTALDAYGKYKASKAEAQAMREQAAWNKLRANEVLERNEINNELLKEEVEELIARQKSALAGQGQSSDIMQIHGQKAFRGMLREAARNDREAQFESRMIIAGAESELRSASAIESAGQMAAVGSALKGGTAIAKSKPGTARPTPSRYDNRSTFDRRGF